MTTSAATWRPDRDLRQRELVPPEALAKADCTVICVGAVGRQVALQLAAMGVPTLQLIDFDTVEAVNLASQGYLLDDLGRSKVRATAEMCRLIYPDVAITQVEDRFRRRVVDVAMIDAQATVAVAAGSAQLHAQAKERAGRLIQRALTPVGWSLRLFGVDDTAIPRKQGFNE